MKDKVMSQMEGTEEIRQVKVMWGPGFVLQKKKDFCGKTGDNVKSAV